MRVLSFILFFIFILNLSGEETIQWVFTDYEPANFVDEKGNYAGFLYEITIEALENRMGIPVKISIYPWPRCQHLVKEGDCDIMITIPTRERLEYTIPTELPVWIKRRLIYTYINHEELETINRLDGFSDIKMAGYSVISYIGNDWIKEYVVDDFHIPVEYAKTVEGMYRMLSAKRGDLVIEEKSIAHSNIKNLGLTELIVETEGVANESHFHLLISKQSSFRNIISELNSVLNDMWEDGTIQKILSKYGA
ncbi:substrate-binding periplasmic protein [Spirochaeta isovalerica]|uniref:Polar amino acid transport system substrate-binding protein n=1 Tax=Spirochaeta isovalerica TaxID=150 RepID=A0A841RCT6_9SPIO|nr:transporter substrate-binding domain-containing protein [Spirochaeta isovalerica]MBB6480669.1 polar amino acid transport system substrate-binding protein [Spirochaeta isovalerica]